MVCVIGERLEQQGLRHARDDRGRVVDLVGHAAHQLAQRGEPLGALQLGLRPALVGDVAGQGHHLADLAFHPHRGIRHPARAPRSVHAGERHLEAHQLPREGAAELVAHERGASRVEVVEHGAGIDVVGGRAHHRPTGIVDLEDAPRSVEDDDRVGDGVHQQPDVALGRRRLRCRESESVAAGVARRRTRQHGGDGASATATDRPVVIERSKDRAGARSARGRVMLDAP
jgi:hypothetical protein